MAEAGLPTPEYIETPNTVKLVLKNNIDERTAHRNQESGEAKNEAKSEAKNEALNDAERTILEIIVEFPQTSQVEIAKKSGFSRSKVQRIMKKLAETEIIYHEGAKKGGLWKVIAK
ncbi:MAG: winged helix-turn-helix transcriptional regulator [Eubacteriales bacterium]|nr:winged helix-turn-helix transcriptional regulator [Eubacteriales bacterium]